MQVEEKIQAHLQEIDVSNIEQILETKAAVEVLKK